MKVYRQKNDYNGNAVHDKHGMLVMELDYIGCNTCGSKDAPHHLTSTAGPVDLCEKCMDARMGRHIPVASERDYIRDAKFEGAIKEIMRDNPELTRAAAIGAWKQRNGVLR